ncbi:MAG: CobW family GTP-binding protein [Nannocystaceae bacterium]|nr:GTP-binding protein [bacterium]
MVRSAPTPVTVIGGFLGAGKTTLLNALIRQGAGRRLGVLVNDFGAINIDADLVVGVDGDMISLGGGCICCSIREDMARSIVEMTRRADAPEHLVVEASGVSDPAAIARAIASPRMQEAVSLDGVVVVIDAEAYLAAGFRERLVIGGQLKAADIVVLSKVDLLDSADVEVVLAKVRKAVPRARVIPAESGSVPPQLLLGLHTDVVPEAGQLGVTLHRADAHAPEHDHGATFSTWSYTTEVPLSPRRLKRVIDGLPPTIFRVKGVVQVARERMRQAVLHVVGRRAELELGAPWGDATPSSRLVFIGAPGSVDPVSLTDMLRACEAPDGDEGSPVMRWVRGIFGT